MRNHLILAVTAIALVAFLSASHADAQTRPTQPRGAAVPRAGVPARTQPQNYAPRAQPRSVPGGPTTPSAGPVPKGAPLALVDIGYIFKNHPEFTANIERMKNEVKQFENQLRQKHQDLQKKQARLSEYNVGSADYKRLEEEIATAQAQLQATTGLKRKEILEREAKIYFSFYQKVRQAVAGYAFNKQIAVVLRFNREEINSQDRGAVLQGVNRPVVNYQKNLDITDEVMQVLGVPGNLATRPQRGNTNPRSRN